MGQVPAEGSSGETQSNAPGLAKETSGADEDAGPKAGPGQLLPVQFSFSAIEPDRGGQRRDARERVLENPEIPSEQPLTFGKDGPPMT